MYTISIKFGKMWSTSPGLQVEATCVSEIEQPTGYDVGRSLGEVLLGAEHCLGGPIDHVIEGIQAAVRERDERRAKQDTDSDGVILTIDGGAE